MTSPAVEAAGVDGSWDEAEGDEPLAPFGLDSVAYGVGGLDAILVVHLGDAHVHAVFVREGAGLSPGDAAAVLRDAYRGSQLAAQRLAAFGAAREPSSPSREPPPAERERSSTAPRARPRGGGSPPARARAGSTTPPGLRDRDGELPGPVVTLEIDGRTVLLRRVRAYVVACVFDGTMPLGMARMLARRLVETISPELPLDDGGPGALLDDASSLFDAPASSKGADEIQSGAAGADPRDAGATSAARTTSRPGRTSPPGRSRPPSRTLPPRPPSNGPARRPTPPPSSVPSVEGERTIRLLSLLDARAPEPHVARLRLALRAGIAPLALEDPDGLGPEAVLLIETAVEDILGLDRATLRRLL